MEDIWNFMVNKDGRRSKGTLGKENIIVGDWNRRRGKKSFLETDNLRFITREKMTEVVSMGGETSNIPLKKRHGRSVIA